jgi:hypothetical protein
VKELEQGKKFKLERERNCSKNWNGNWEKGETVSGKRIGSELLKEEEQEL